MDGRFVMNSADMAAKEMARPVGPLQLLALGVNGIVGVGIFFTPATVAASAPGFGGVWVFLLTGLAVVPVAFAFAVLGRRFDQDGGPVVFARAAFGDLPSFVAGWVAYVSAFFSTAAVMGGLTRAVSADLGLEGHVALGLGATALVTALGLIVATGIRISARTWTVLTVLKLLPLFALLAAFLAFGGRGGPAAAPARFEASWLSAGLAAMFTYQGFEIVPVIAGQVRGSARSIPFATVGSLLFAILLYIGLVWACVSALPGLATEATPLAAAARVYGGGSLSRVVGWGTNLSSLGICFGMMVTTPRYLSALASGERDLFGLDRFNARDVPMRALLVTWVIVTGFVNSVDPNELFKLSSIAVLAQYGVSAAALAALSLRRQRGFVPAHAVLAVPTIALGIVLTFGATAREGLVALLAVLAGLALAAVARPRTRPA